MHRSRLETSARRSAVSAAGRIEALGRFPSPEKHGLELQHVGAPQNLVFGLVAKLVGHFPAPRDVLDADKVGCDLDAVGQIADLVRATGGNEDSLSGSLEDPE